MTYDEKEAVWYHINCFFTKAAQRHLQTGQIENFENISYYDQLEVIAKIDPKEAHKFEEIARKRQEEKSFSFKNFEVDYAGTVAEVCASCQSVIEHKEARIKCVVYDSIKASKFGKEIVWAHMACFAFDRHKYKYLWDGKLMDGFENLQPEHQSLIAEWIP
jgi:hypothetical protein